MRYFGAVVGFLGCFPMIGHADAIDDCIRQLVEVRAENVSVARGSVGYDLTIKNSMSVDLGGVIIRYTLNAKGRPVPLMEGYGQLSHTLGGGLLSGETTVIRDFIGMHKRELKLAKGAPSLSVDVTVVNVADLEHKPIGTENDPYLLWKTEQSGALCEKQPE